MYTINTKNYAYLSSAYVLLASTSEVLYNILTPTGMDAEFSDAIVDVVCW